MNAYEISVAIYFADEVLATQRRFHKKHKLVSKNTTGAYPTTGYSFLTTALNSKYTFSLIPSSASGE